MSDDPPPDDKSTPSGRNPVRIYVDADVLFAGASSPSEHSASQVVLTLSEITLMEGVTSELAVKECRHNLQAKIPDATGDFDCLVNRSLTARRVPNRERFSLTSTGPTRRIFLTLSRPSRLTVGT
jgi:predicted nucleic acid-binding protein